MSRIICIDVGHCETAASTIKQENGSLKSVRMQMDENNNLVVSSAITLSNDQMSKLRGQAATKTVLDSLGTIKIGNSANANPEDGEYFVYFKRSPEKFDAPCGTSAMAKWSELTHGKLMAAFVYQIMKNLMKYNEEFEGVDCSEIQLLIGCPTTRKWTDEKNGIRYAELIWRATGVKTVTIMPESRAAMFSSIERGHNCFSAANGIIVFDFGSSTSDCTYMLLGRRIEEFSWDLGASMIEQQMMMAAYEQCRKAYGNEIKDLQLMSPMSSDMLRTLRKAKEAYYVGHTGRTVCSFIDVNGEEFEVIQKENETLMNEIISGYEVECECDSKTVVTGSWRAICKRFFQEAKKRLDREKLPCSAIILTGGASRMDFIVTICKEVFPGVKVYRDANPSYSVSNGLGWAAVADERYSDCLADARSELKANGKGGLSSLEEGLQEKLRKHVFDKIKECSKQWADSAVDMSAGDLSQMVQNKLDSKDEKQIINKIIQDEIDAWKNGFKDAVQQAVNKQANRLFSEEVAQGLILSDEVWENLQADSINVDVNIDSILNNLDLSGILNRIVQWVVGTTVALAVAAAFSWLPGFNVIAGGLAGIIAAAMISDDDKNKKRDQDQRKKISGQMDNVLARAEVIANFNSGISDALSVCREEFDQMAENTLTIAFDIITLRRFQV